MFCCCLRTLLQLQASAIVLSAAALPEYAASAQLLETSGQALLAAIMRLLSEPVDSAAAARAALSKMVGLLRQLDVAAGGGHTRCADMLQLYANTQVRASCAESAHRGALLQRGTSRLQHLLFVDHVRAPVPGMRTLMVRASLLLLPCPVCRARNAAGVV